MLKKPIYTLALACTPLVVPLFCAQSASRENSWSCNSTSAFRDPIDLASAPDKNSPSTDHSAGRAGIAEDTWHPAIIFVSPSGSDSKDGLSWGTAKKTIYAALEALPGGASRPPTAGSGLVYLADGVSANPIANGGIWLLGHTDPNYNSPPPGWLRAGGPISIIGGGCRNANANNPVGQCAVTAGGAADNLHPAVWLSGMNASMKFENLMFEYPGKVISLGIDSTGNRSGPGGVQNILFDNVAGAVAQKVGNGPAVDIGSNTFDIWFTHSSFNGNYAEQAPISRMIRSSNVITITTSSQFATTSSDRCGILQAQDASFNGSFSRISAGRGTRFTVSQPGPDASTTGGVLICDKSIPMVVDPGSGTGSGLIFVQNGEFNGGGVRLWGGSSGVNLYLDHFYYEGDFAHALPPGLWIGSQVNGQFVHVSDIQAADGVGPSPIIENDCAECAPDELLVEGMGNLVGGGLGPMTVQGASDYNSAINPALMNQTGIINGHLKAQTDAARSAPQSVRFKNLVSTANTSWTGTRSIRIRNNMTDRDGGTNAADVTSSANSDYLLLNHDVPVTTQVGDVFICGAWVRSMAHFSPYLGAGYSGSATNPLQCTLYNAVYTYQWTINHGGPNAGDNEWEWVWIAFKIASQSSSHGRFGATVNVSDKKPVQVYDPIVLHIPAGQISDGEAANLALNLRSYHESCSPGMVCDTIGQLPHVNASQTWSARQSFGTISINGENMNSAPRSAQNFFLPGPLNSTWIASTWTPDKAVTLTRIQVQVKTGPAGCSVNAVVRITDGKNPVNLTVSAAGNDSGRIAQTFAAGVPLTISVQSPASQCTQIPADANITIQYRTE